MSTHPPEGQIRTPEPQREESAQPEMNQEAQPGAPGQPGPEPYAPASSARASYPQSPYAQPPYGQAPYAPPPGGNPPQYPGAPYPPYYGPPQPRHRNRIIWIIGAIAGLLLVGVVAVAVLIALGLGLFARSVGGTDYTRASQQSFTVSGVPTVVIDSSAGSITIRQGTANQVQVQANRVVRTDNSSAGENALDQFPVEMRQNGDTINVTSRFDTNIFDGVSLTRRVDYVVIVPATANLNFRLSAGNVSVTGITGNMLTTVSAGNVEIADATLSGASNFSVNAGAIKFNGTLQPGSSLHTKVSTGNTNLMLPQALPAHIEADTNVGNISINGWPISPSRERAVNSHASGDLNTPTNVNITSEVSVGNITLTAK